MSSGQLQNEFDLNLFTLARTTMREQVHANYALMRVIKSSVLVRFFEFIKTFDMTEQLKFADALVKRVHPRAAEFSGDALSDEDERLIFQYLNSPLPASSIERELAARYGGNASKKHFTNISRSTLKSLLTNTVKEVYCAAKVNWSTGEADVEMISGHIRILTNLDISNQWQRLRYFHRVYCDKQELHPKIAPLELWGIGGTNWDQAETAEQIDAGFRKLSIYFLSALPSLFPVELLRS